MALSLNHIALFTKSSLSSNLRCLFLPGNEAVRSICNKSTNEDVKDKSAKKNVDCFSQVKPLSETRFITATHIIMDLDGVVLDSAKFYFEAHAKYLAKYKKRYTPELKTKTIGIHDVDAARYLVEELMLPLTPEVYVHGVWQFLRQDLSKAKLIDGVRDILCHFQEHKIPVALATSSNTKSFDLKMKHHKDILQYFCHVVKGDDPELKHGKPAADIYELTASRFVVQPKPYESTKFLIIEDSIMGIQAAKNAGMQAILFPDKSLPRKLLKGADLIIERFSDIDLAEFSLPRLNK